MENFDIEKLKTSLIYKMSLGSKELYHSNVLAWLIEQDSAFVQAFFPPSSIPQGASFKKVEREEGKRDISIWYNWPDGSSKCFVIENKLKSIPNNNNQLKDYTNALKESFAEGVLTGLVRPNIVNETDIIEINGKLWRFVKYSEISKKIRQIANESTAPVIVENRDVILEYVDNNECVEKIVNSAIVPKRLEQKTEKDALNELGLSDLVNKITGSEFVHYVNERLRQDGISIPFFFTAEGFHNKKITLDFRLSNSEDYYDGKYTYLIIGIQIEGYQYRRMVDRVSGYCDAEVIFQEFAEKGFFDPNYDKQKVIRFPNDTEMLRPTKMSKQYDQYGNTCVYQYSILEGDDLNFENIYQRIKNDILVASRIMEENNKQEYRKTLQMK